MRFLVIKNCSFWCFIWHCVAVFLLLNWACSLTFQFSSVVVFIVSIFGRIYYTHSSKFTRKSYQLSKFFRYWKTLKRNRYHFFFDYLFYWGHEVADAINCSHKVRKFVFVSRCKCSISNLRSQSLIIFSIPRNILKRVLLCNFLWMMFYFQ